MPTVEPWMRLGVCNVFPELPWLAEAGDATRSQVLTMRAVCRACGAFERCAVYVEETQVSAGFWAGRFRDVPVEAFRGAA